MPARFASSVFTIFLASYASGHLARGMLCAPTSAGMVSGAERSAKNCCMGTLGVAQEKCCKASCGKAAMPACCGAEQVQKDSGKREQGGSSQAAAEQPKEAETALLVSLGKPIFVERCGACHNERGDKPLVDGPPLNERKLSLEKIERAARGRLKGRTEEQQRAVALYISSLLKK